MGIDKATLYPTYLKSQERAEKLREAAIRKNLDLPAENDVHICNHGIAGKHFVALGVLILTGLLGWRALEPSSPGVPPPVGVSTAPTPAIQEYEVSFWAEDGTEIEVEKPE